MDTISQSLALPDQHLVGGGEDENAPLLVSSFIAVQPPTGACREDHRGRRRQRVTVIVFALMVVVNIPSLLQESAQVQIFEDICCANYYERNGLRGQPLDTRLCKIDNIQGDVAMLRGWRAFFNFLPGTNTSGYEVERASC